MSIKKIIITMKITKILLLLLITSLLVSCGGENPAISKIIIKSDREGVLLDTEDRSTIKILEKIFYEKEEAPDAGPDYKYLIDITINNETIRWQYSADGFIRNFEITNGMIYQLRDVAEFNRTVKII
jgi:hypothetical protein